MEVVINLPSNNKLSHCRFCAEAKRAGDLIKISNAERNGQTKYIMQFLHMDFIDLSEGNKLPKAVCEGCYTQMDSVYQFMSKVEESQGILSSIYNDSDENVQQIDIEIKEEMDIADAEEPGELMSTNSKEIVYIRNRKCVPKSHHTKKPMESFMAHKDLKDNIASLLTSESKPPLKLKLEPPKVSKVKIETVTSNTVQIQTRNESDNKIKLENEDTDPSDNSWTSYSWCCIHCKMEYDTMDEIRTHSKFQHGKCFGFCCADCDKKFNNFNAYIEHVRLHHDILRNYCQYCNQKFSDATQCFEHTLSHWEGTQKICTLCGEILPDITALERHNDIYKKVKLKITNNFQRPKLLPTLESQDASNNMWERSWKSYEWTCQDCCLRMPDVDTLRKHVQEVHNKCFSMKCVDCLTVMYNFRTFVYHVSKHRSYLTQYCEYCNANIHDSRKMDEHIKEHVTGSQKPCDGCGQIFENNTLMFKHMKEFEAPRSKGYPVSTEDLTCDICNKRFTNLSKVKYHRRRHNTNRQRYYTCDTCGKAFLTESCMKSHKKLHGTKTEVCHICKKEFHLKRQLKKHVASHIEEKLVECNQCSKKFTTKILLRNHLKCHSDVKAHKCQVCGKTFKLNNTLKIHMNQHTGLRPFSCEVCERTFSCWSNCDKHMVRIHGISLAKKNKTEDASKPKQLNEMEREWVNALVHDLVN